MKRNRKSYVLLSAAILSALVLIFAQFVPLTAVASGSTVVACANKKTGALRIAYKKCTRKENSISWGQTGAQGAAGPAGAQGPAGPAGAQGPAGAVGAQGAVGTQGTVGAQGVQGEQGPLGLDQVDLKVVSYASDSSGRILYNRCLDATLIGTQFCGLDLPSDKDAYLVSADNQTGTVADFSLTIATKSCSDVISDFASNPSETQDSLSGIPPYAYRTQFFNTGTNYSSVRTVGAPIRPSTGARCLIFPMAFLASAGTPVNVWYVAVTDKP